MNFSVVGVDVSKAKLDICLEQLNPKSGKSILKHLKVDNNDKGFVKFLAVLPENALFVMESTGTYHLPLCLFLNKHGLAYNVANARHIKRFAEVDKRTKTDKQDAFIIRQYGIEKGIKPQKPIQESDIQLKQASTAVDFFSKELVRISNFIESIQASSCTDKKTLRRIKKHYKETAAILAEAEAYLAELGSERYEEDVTLLETIPGLGNKTAVQILVQTGGLERFEAPKQLIAYAGLDPCQRQSGSSVHGQSKITKRGNKRLRRALYMASLSALRWNPACKLLYDRLIAKGKKKKQALIAVCNKLLRQALAIVKQGVPFDPKFA
jgi:transposase